MSHPLSFALATAGFLLLVLAGALAARTPHFPVSHYAAAALALQAAIVIALFGFACVAVAVLLFVLAL